MPPRRPRGRVANSRACCVLPRSVKLPSLLSSSSSKPPPPLHSRSSSETPGAAPRARNCLSSSSDRPNASLGGMASAAAPPKTVCVLPPIPPGPAPPAARVAAKLSPPACIGAPAVAPAVTAPPAAACESRKRTTELGREAEAGGGPKRALCRTRAGKGRALESAVAVRARVRAVCGRVGPAEGGGGRATELAAAELGRPSAAGGCREAAAAEPGRLRARGDGEAMGDTNGGCCGCVRCGVRCGVRGCASSSCRVTEVWC